MNCDKECLFFIMNLAIRLPGIKNNTQELEGSSILPQVLKFIPESYKRQFVLIYL